MIAAQNMNPRVDAYCAKVQTFAQPILAHLRARDKRIATALAWIAEGKQRNWKYQNC